MSSSVSQLTASDRPKPRATGSGTGTGTGNEYHAGVTADGKLESGTLRGVSTPLENWIWPTFRDRVSFVWVCRGGLVITQE